VDRAQAELRMSTDKSVTPKGVAPGTTDELARAERHRANGLTANEAVKLVGVSRVTAWRYLERLADDGNRHPPHGLR